MNLLKYPVMRDKILPFLGYSIINFISKTLEIEYINREILDEYVKNNRNFIFAFWHGRHFLLPHTHRHLKISVMTSVSRDGELLTNILKKFGYRCVRGSSSKEGIKGLKAIVRDVKNGYSAAIAVDGPRGPLYKSKPGVIFLARITGLDIIPVSFSSYRAKIFNSWDKYMLPYPFTKAVMIYGKPLKIKRDDNIEEKTAELDEILIKLTEMADEAVKK